MTERIAYNEYAKLKDNNNENLSISLRQYKASKLVHIFIQHAHYKTTLC